MVSHIPDAIAHGAEIRTDCMAAELLPASDDAIRGVRYFHAPRADGQLVEHVQRAKAVIVAGYAIESPRLLLNSSSAAFPNGVGNTSGLVGKFLMAQAGPVVWGRFDEPIRQYKAPPACALSEAFYETDPRNDFVRGYALQTVAPLPIAMSHLLIEEEGEYGERLLRRMQDYNHYAAFGVLGEILPDARNSVTLHPTERDRFGLPAPYAHFSMFDNDRRMMEAGIRRARAVLQAAGATETHAVTRFAHLVGTCRMGFSPRDSVVDQWCRSWDVPNLLVCDGSVLPTQGSANPAITISALAARVADWLRRAAPAGELRTRARSAM
jgi:choline dehydrogenase-like flavoprotein